MTKKGSEKSLAVPRQPLGGAQRAPPSRKAGPLVRYAQSPAQGLLAPGNPKEVVGQRKSQKMQECCIFLNAFPLPSTLTPPGPISSVGVGADSISARNVRVPIGASGTPPPTRNHTVAVGASSARPRGLTLLLNCTGEHCSPLRSLCHWYCREGS